VIMAWMGSLVVGLAPNYYCDSAVIGMRFQNRLERAGPVGNSPTNFGGLVGKIV
jgi:hypothetical protein